MGEPEPGGGLPPVFPAICLVRTWNGFGTGFFVGERANVVTARHVICHDERDDSDCESKNPTRDPNDPANNREPGECEPGKPERQEQAIVVCWVCTGRGFLFNAVAEIVHEDRRTDLALLRLKNPEEFPRPLSLDSVTSLSPVLALPGDFVYFDAFRRTPRDTFECCRVRARVKKIEPAKIEGLHQRILTLDAHAWPGSSGSPVFSRSGEVIGVITNCLRDTAEAVVRDGCCVWELFGKTRNQPQTAAIPFFPSSFAPYMHDPWWSPLQQLSLKMLSYFGRPWIR